MGLVEPVLHIAGPDNSGRLHKWNMICQFLDKKLIFLIALALVGLLGPAGCTRHNYKTEADTQTYDIIDQKWQAEFGPKTNYRISDVVPSPNDLQTERAAPADGILTLPQAVAIATAHNREYQTQRELLYTTALDLRLTRHEFENKLFGGASGGYSRDRNDGVMGLDASIGFNRLLATGTAISTKVGAAWINVLSGNTRGGLAAIFGATVTQPLLRGSDRKVVLEPLTQAERNTLYQLRSFSRFRKTFVVSVIGQYYHVLVLGDKAKNAKECYDKLVGLYERADKLAQVGRLPKYEVAEINQRKLEAWDDYIQADKEYRMMLDLFKITVSLPTVSEFKPDERELETLRVAELKYPELSDGEVVGTALSGRLDLANSADAVVDAQRQIYVAADGLRGGANLVGNVDVVSGGRGSRQTLKAKENYSADLELDLPLDRVAEQNVYRKALITLSQRQREYELLSDTVAVEVRQAHRDLVEAAQRYGTHLEALKVAEKRFKDTFLLMQYGRASSRRAVSALQDLRDAKDGATEALVNYTVATLNFYRDTEVLQVRPDGMWEMSPRKTTVAVGLPVEDGNSKAEGDKNGFRGEDSASAQITAARDNRLE